MRFSLLGSGSSGNATWVETDRVRLLIDCGLSARETEKRLQAIGRDLASLEAVLLTHEHEDHSRGLALIVEATGCTVLASPGTLRAMRPALPERGDRIALKDGAETRFGDLTVSAFRVPHDAHEPVGFRLCAGSAALGYATDLGMINDLVRERLGGLSTLILESNHDVELVKSGPYPQRLKKRILSPFGHLSNEGLGEFLLTADIASLERLYLAHLSRTNNRPDLALAVASVALSTRGARPELCLASHDRPTPLIPVQTGAAGRPAPTPSPPPVARQMAFRFEF